MTDMKRGKALRRPHKILEGMKALEEETTLVLERVYTLLGEEQ